MLLSLAGRGPQQGLPSAFGQGNPGSGEAASLSTPVARLPAEASLSALVPSAHSCLGWRWAALPAPAQRRLHTPAPASPLLQNSRSDLGEEITLASSSQGDTVHPLVKPWHPDCHIPCSLPVPSPPQPCWSQQLGTGSHGSDSTAAPVPRFESLQFVHRAAWSRF